MNASGQHSLGEVFTLLNSLTRASIENLERALGRAVALVNASKDALPPGARVNVLVGGRPPLRKIHLQFRVRGQTLRRLVVQEDCLTVTAPEMVKNELARFVNDCWEVLEEV